MIRRPSRSTRTSHSFPTRRSSYLHDFRMDDAGLVREIMVAPESVIVQSFLRTIGRARNGTRSVGAADDLGREMVDRHNSPYTAFLSARRQRRISAHLHSLPFA